ncbi:uncharacterized protein JCM10292_000708 [Rhodotorula paludigena]|uniref:uncharacterized protein n=1 Tax=Rhodotorula paludigena TaxID=86838 RepID=UPI003181E85E
MSDRRTPPRPIHITSRQGRTVGPSAFGISTFSQRAPRPRTSSLPKEASTLTSASTDRHARLASLKGDSQLAAVEPSLGRPDTTRETAVAVDVHPPTPQDVLHDEVAAKARPDVADTVRTLKQTRRTASIYSVSSSVGVVLAKNGRKDGVSSIYLRPDLSSASGLSLDQVPRSVSLEDLRAGGPAASSASQIAEAGTRTALQPSLLSRSDSEEVSSHSTVSLPHHGTSLSHSSSFLHLNAAQSVVDQPPRHARPPAPPAHAPPPSYASHRAVQPSSRTLRTETESERLKRLYLCPWEGAAPLDRHGASSNGSRTSSTEVALAGVRPRAYLVGGEVDLEKGAYIHDEQALSRTGNGDGRVRSTALQKRKKALVTVGLALLVLLVVADLIVLNVRVFSLSDAYYDD